MRESLCHFPCFALDSDAGDFLPFLTSTNSSAEEILETLTKSARDLDGRANLAKSHAVPALLILIQRLSSSKDRNLLISSLKLLRNLCAGEILNQNAFISYNGVETISLIIGSVLSESDPEWDIIGMCLQVLGNVALAGEEHQLLIWTCFFPDPFTEIARIRRRETCDPLCMTVYTCCNENQRLYDIFTDLGLTLVAEIVCSASGVGFGDPHWLKMILSTFCFKESFLHTLFSKLHMLSCSESKQRYPYLPEHSYLLEILSDILLSFQGDDNNHTINISTDFALQILQILKRTIEMVDFSPKSRTKLPTGDTEIDILGHSLVILRFVCAQDRSTTTEDGGVVETLIHADIIDTLLNLLRELGPPSITRRSCMGDRGTPSRPKTCPYKGFRRDIVAVVANSCHRRRYVQNEIRSRDGILLVLQQCVVDEDNPFLREWGIWCVRNLLEENSENRSVISELELLAPVNLPEITELGFCVKVDRTTRRPTLENIY